MHNNPIRTDINKFMINIVFFVTLLITGCFSQMSYVPVCLDNINSFSYHHIELYKDSVLTVNSGLPFYSVKSETDYTNCSLDVTDVNNSEFKVKDISIEVFDKDTSKQIKASKFKVDVLRFDKTWVHSTNITYSDLPDSLKSIDSHNLVILYTYSLLRKDLAHCKVAIVHYNVIVNTGGKEIMIDKKVPIRRIHEMVLVD